MKECTQAPKVVPHAAIRRHGEEAFALYPVVFFTPARRAQFKKAAAGGRFEWRTKVWVITPDKVHAIVRNLRGSGFNVRVDKDALDRFERRDLQAAHELALVRDRVRLFDAALAKQGVSLYPYQRTGAEWLATRDRAHLGDEMGLGKTWEIIAALPTDARVVVVCPVSIKGNWAKELLRLRPSFRVSVLAGKESFRWPSPNEVVILNYEILPDVHSSECPDRLPVDVEDEDPFSPEAMKRASDVAARPPCSGCSTLLQECPDGVVLVGDESHLLKGARTQRTERFRSLGGVARRKAGRTWLSTGSPLLNRPEDLWNLYEAADLGREAFGSYTDFVRVFGGKVKTLGNGKYAGVAWPKPPAPLPEAAERIAKVSLRRLKADVWEEMPAKTWRIVPVELSHEDLAFVDSELKASGMTVESVCRAIEEGRELGFKKIAAARAALAAGKCRALVEYLREEFESQDEPVVVFSAHRAPVDLLEKRTGWAAISGGISHKKRTELVESFQAGKLKGIAITIGAGGVGITLTRASNAVFVDRDWSPEANKQAEDRIHRIGQRFPCCYTDLASTHPLDLRVTEILQHKAKLVAESVDAAAEGRRLG